MSKLNGWMLCGAAAATLLMTLPTADAGHRRKCRKAWKHSQCCNTSYTHASPCGASACGGCGQQAVQFQSGCPCNGGTASYGGSMQPYSGQQPYSAARPTFDDNAPVPADQYNPAPGVDQNLQVDPQLRDQREIDRANRNLNDAQRDLNNTQRDAQRNLNDAQRDAQRDVNRAQRNAERDVNEAQRDAQRNLDRNPSDAIEPNDVNEDVVPDAPIQD